MQRALGYLAAVSLRHAALLLTLDSDFDRIPGLRRLRPAGGR